MSEEDIQKANNISSHILDIATGVPANGVNCTAFIWNETTEQWTSLANTKTDEHGRIPLVHPGHELKQGTYKLQFLVGEYYKNLGQRTFFPQIEVIFEIDDNKRHYHVPLTLSNYGYSTYKGQ